MVYLAKGFQAEIINRYFSWVMPFVYLSIACQWFFSERIERYLTDSDDFCEDKIKVRLYGMITTITTLGFFVGTDIYFIYCCCIPESLFCSFLVFAYIFIRINVYCVKLTYSDGIIRYKAWSKELQFSFEQITKACWEDERHRIGYSLVIYTDSGHKITLSSRDFVGLNKLREVIGRIKE